MIKNLLLVALRNIRRNLSYSVLNVLGLTLGVAAAIVIFLVVRNELSYDNYHQKAARIYRVTMNNLDFNSSVSMAIAPAMREDFPELQQVSQIWYQGDGLVKVGNNRYNEKGYYFADQPFNNVFDLQWVAGDAKTALSAPNTIVLTESIAKKYFGNKDAMGQLINLDNQFDLKVSGIIKDQPANTHLPFLFLVSFETVTRDLKPAQLPFYAIMGGHTYIVAPEHYNIDQLRRRMPEFIKKHWGADKASETKLLLQPLNEIHYDQRYEGNPASPTVSKQAYQVLAAIGILILLIAVINFINLSTAQSIKRAKEVGVRKVLGAVRGQLVRQFLGETAVLVLLAIIAGTSIAALFLIRTEEWLGIKIGPEAVTKPTVLFFIGIVGIGLIVLAGLYPAFVQSAFKPAAAFRSMKTPVIRGLSLRKGLVVSQFVISQMLIIGTLVVAWQMDYFRNQDLGFNKEAIVSFFLPGAEQREAVKQQVQGLAGVKQVSLSTGAPGYSANFAPFSAPDRGIVKDDVTEIKYVDEAYTDMFGLTMLAGKKIARKEANDTLGYVVVNETLIHKLNIQDPQQAIGVVFKGSGRRFTITGVMQDFQSESKHKLRRPLIVDYSPRRFFRASVKLGPGNQLQTMAAIEKIWSAAYPESLFEYEFLDERIASFYRQEEKVYTAFRLFAGIAILIGCLGLYGLITLATVQRTKEVGVRKVLGASLGSILFMFSKEFIWFIGIAFCIAAPIAWYVMNSWLQNFAYHINIGAGIFVAAIIVSVLMAALTISWQTLKAALANPVKALRSE